MLKSFFTSIWFKPNKFPYYLINYLPNTIAGFLNSKLRKKHFDLIDDSLVHQIPAYEFIGRIKIFFTKSHYSKWYWVNKKYDKCISRKIKKEDFDVFIGYETSSLECFRVCKGLNKKSILDFAAIHPFYQREILNNLGINPYGNNILWNKVDKRKLEELDIVDYIFTPSEFAKKTLLDGGIKDNKILKFPYGCDIDLFKQKSNYKMSGKFTILYVGNINLRKGIQYLLKAVKELNMEDINFTMIGNISDRDLSLNEYNGFYRHIPFIDQQSLVKYYHDADLFVFPSLMDSYGMVVLEAMACGTPVIVSENTGAKDAIRDGVDGFIVPIMNVRDLKEKILHCYKNRDKMENMGRNARSQAEKYTWEEYGNQVKNAIYKIMGSNY